MNWIFIISIWLILFNPIIAVCQNSDSMQYDKHSISLKIRINQYKDQFNYGLVFHGGGFLGEYSFSKADNNFNFSYSANLGLDVFHNTGAGFSLIVEPIDLFYGFAIVRNQDKPVYLGGYYSMNYSWQFYPSLQTGHMLWLTSLELGPKIIIKPFQQYDKLKITFSNSVFGFISRPTRSTEVYFYSLKFRDFINNAHSNFQAGSFGSFNHTKIKIEMERFIRNKTSLAYEFDYFGYYQYPKFQRMAHSILLKWKL